MIRKISALTIATLAVVLVFQGVKFGMASLYAIAVENSIEVLTSNSDNISLSELDRLDYLVDEMRSWDDKHPYYLSLAASFYSWDDYLSGSEREVSSARSSIVSRPIVSRSMVSRPLELESKAISIRPVWSNSHTQRALYLWRSNANTGEILTALSHAQNVGPFESSTALVSLDIYLAHWSELNTTERVLASRYLLQPDKYRVSYWALSKLIERSSGKNRACSLLAFNNINMKTCG